MNPRVSQYFSNIVTAADENINLAEAALYIAKSEFADLDTGKYLLMLDDMAAGLRRQSGLANRHSAKQVINGINDYLFNELGFSANWKNFNDPGNNYLNIVLDKKLGIPISLSLVYVELAKRLGLSMFGVSFPGHFLVKFINRAKEYIIDPFSCGIILGEPELRERLTHFTSQQLGARTVQRLCQAAGKREFLARLLRNLKKIYMEAEAYDKALTASNLHLMLQPDSPTGLRDRACVFDKLECYRAASEDFQRYLDLNPAAADYQPVRMRQRELQDLISRMH